MVAEGEAGDTVGEVRAVDMPDDCAAAGGTLVLVNAVDVLAEPFAADGVYSMKSTQNHVALVTDAAVTVSVCSPSSSVGELKSTCWNTVVSLPGVTTFAGVDASSW